MRMIIFKSLVVASVLTAVAYGAWWSFQPDFHLQCCEKFSQPQNLTGCSNETYYLDSQCSGKPMNFWDSLNWKNDVYYVTPIMGGWVTTTYQGEINQKHDQGKNFSCTINGVDAT